MILSDHFVFVHVPKTGGTFVRDLCNAFAPADWHVTILPNHPSVREIPNEYKTLPRLGFVRNPFDWYVSWYFYLKETGGNPIFDRISKRGTRGLKDSLMTLLETKPGEFFDLEPSRCADLTLSYSWYLLYLFDNDLDSVLLGKFEHLRSDVIRLFGSICPLPVSFVEAVQQGPKINVSRRGDYRDYYDKELQVAIQSSDQTILDRFGYRF